MRREENGLMRKYEVEIGIYNKGRLYIPLVVDGVTLSSHYRGVPSELNFTVIKDKLLDFTEGNSVYLKFNGEMMFYGFIFEKVRDDVDIISVKAYDQIRYLQCRDSIEFPDMTASEYVKFISERVLLTYDKEGLEDTKVLLHSVVEEGTSYIDMILHALDKTKEQSYEEFVLYDDCCNLKLKNVVSLKSKYCICADNTESFTYTTSIDKETYTQVRVVKSNGREHKNTEVVEENKEAMNKWGVLVYYEQLRDEENIQAKADQMLKQYCRRTVNLSLKNVIGYPDVRGGSCVFVELALGDMNVNQYFTVTRCTHSFIDGGHFMTLDVKGGIIGE